MGKEDAVEKIRGIVEQGLEQAFLPFTLTERDTISQGTRMRCLWTVTAGVVPGHVMTEHTKRWCLTSETWSRENEMSDEEFKKEFPDGKSTYAKYRDEAHEYAASLNHPNHLNWVKIEWMWM